MDSLKRHWFQIMLGYCAMWIAVNLLAVFMLGSDAAVIAEAVGALGFGIVCGGLVLLDMYVPSLRHWLR